MQNYHWLVLVHAHINSNLISHCSENLFTRSKEELLSLGFNHNQIQKLLRPDKKTIEKELLILHERHYHLVTYHDQNYPALLKEVYDAPLALYVAGNPQILNSTQVAIVGARNASPIGVRTAFGFAEHLGHANITVTSGLARGIDTASHRGALAANGTTIAVFGTGLTNIYPRSNQALAQQIIEKNGALVSEFPLETAPLAQHFPMRNRIISGLSKGVLIVEAALRSGSLITARMALEQGRDVFAIPGSIQHALSKGCHHLIKQGAKLVESAAEILEEIGEVKNSTPEKIKKVTSALSPLQKQIIDQIDYAMTPVDMIISRSGLTSAEVSSILLSLELQGFIQSGPGGYIRIL